MLRRYADGMSSNNRWDEKTPRSEARNASIEPLREAIEDALDALVESIYDALPESVELRRDGSYGADGEPWTREHKRKLRRKRPLTPHHLDVYFSSDPSMHDALFRC